MDTIPFHLMMFALDVLLVMGLYAWPSQRSTFWGLASIVVFGGVGMFGIGMFSVIFRTNRGQCLVEGLTYHGTFFLLIAAGMLFWKKRRRIALLSALLGICIFVPGFDMLVWEPNSLAVERYTIESAKIKYPIRIVFVADIQTDHIGRHERRTLQKIMEQKADLIILGGDYLQTYHENEKLAKLEDQFRTMFLEIPLSAPLGVYAIAGNLDTPNPTGFNALFADTGIEPVYGSLLLDNWGVEQKKGPIDLALLSMGNSIDGVEDRAHTGSGLFSIMVGHYPIYAIENYQKVDGAPDLMLAGHTHGGQFALPFYGPVKIKHQGRDRRIPREFMTGLHTFPNGSKLLVSRGTGMERGWAPRVRFFCKPEISVIDLLPAPISKSTESP